MEVPGPKPWPVVGTLLKEMTSFVPDLDANWSKRYGEIFGVFEGRTPSLRISDPDMIRDICIKEFNNFTNRRTLDLSAIDPIFNKFITILKGAEWKRTRNVMSPTFTGGKMRLMVPLIDSCGKRLKDVLEISAQKGESVEIKTKLVNYMLEVIASCAFGMEINAQKNEDDVFAKNAKVLLSQRKFHLFILFFILPPFITKRLPIQVFNRGAMNFFKKALSEIIQCRMASKERRNDFLQLMLDALIEAEKEDPDTNATEKVEGQNNATTETPTYADVKKVLTSDGVLAQSLIFIIAGFDTISSTLAFVCHSLAIYPECQDKLLEEVDSVIEKNDGKLTYESIAQMHYMDMVISETLRLYPAALRTDRESSKDCRIKDIVIPKGMVITINVYAVHQNEAFYPDPKKFDPERFSPENKEKRHPCAYLPFGVGPRNCIGMRFALLEMKLTLANILKDFRFVRCPETEVPIKFEKAVPGFLPKNGIFLKLEKRH